MSLRAGLGALLLALALPAAAQAGQPCAWPAKSDENLLNVGYPDQAATYWLAGAPVTPAKSLVIRGTYPNARYFSFHAYDAAQRPVGSIADASIKPDRGSENPFAEERVRGGRYTIRVVWAPRPARPKPNTIYAGRTAEGLVNPAALVLYRIYVPGEPNDLAGSVPLPDVSVVTPLGRELRLGRCTPLPPSGRGGLSELERHGDFPDAVPRVVPLARASNPPVWSRFYGLDRLVWNGVPSNPLTDGLPRSAAGFFSNDQVAYIRTTLSRQFGDVAVVRLRAPTFPDTRSGESVLADRQVRYWSLCENEFATQRFIACLRDDEAVQDAHGYVTVVVSDVGDRPANATRANGINWLPWGSLHYDGLLIYRHMLPSPTFEEAVQRIPEGTDAASVMRSYLPVARYCTKEEFERDACPLGS